MKLLIRADANSHIGGGHVMRCLSLAAAWQARGGEVVFVTTGDTLANAIRQQNIELIQLADAMPSADEDARVTLEAAIQSAADGVLIDGYHFKADYLQAIHDAHYRCVYVDDDGVLSHYPADIVLNFNIHADASLYTGKIAPDTRLLLGLDYAPLRTQFAPYQQWQRTIPAAARHILVTFGWADPPNQTAKVVEALKRLPLPYQARIVVGGGYNHLDDLRAALDSNMELIVSAQDMPGLMQWADVAVSAAGTTCWEMAFMGVPFITLEIASNQRIVAERLADAGAAMNAGWFEDVTVATIKHLLTDLMRDAQQRQRMSQQGRRLVDGRGAMRAAAAIENSMRGKQ
jgi:UDP-2,4-diacetamido-2,4,6-trideoxy-beta-L-altropyranose hydrolase